MNQPPDFKKFAAELVSTSEIFEPRAKKCQAGMHESLELLGSLASLTQSSLVKRALAEGAESSASAPGPSRGQQTAPVRYETSKAEYRLALGDQKIADALGLLQNLQNQSNPPKNGGFQAAAPKAVAASIKPSATVRRPGIYNPILRTSE